MSAVNSVNTVPPVGPKLFISYRRADSASVAGRIYDRLTAYFGREALFKDVDNIPIGANFEQVIADVVRQCAIALVLIGPAWATIATEHGRRLDDPHDVVRLEVETALQRGIPVIPVLVEGAAMPDPATLPPSLRPLFAYGALQVRNNPWFDGDMSELATTVGRWLPLRSAGAGPATGPMPPSAAIPTYPGQQGVGQSSLPGSQTRAPRRRGWLASPLGLTAVVVLVMAVALLSLAGAGLAGVGPFGRAGANSTPLATAPVQPTATKAPAEHVILNASLTKPQTGWEVDSGCAFAADGYHVTASPGYLAYCHSPSSYVNFHLKARVHAPAGATRADYVLFFRISDSSNFDYIEISFNLVPRLPPTATVGPDGITPTPDYSNDALWSVFSYTHGTDVDLGSDITPAAHVTGDGDNLLEVYAAGPVFTVLVNGQQLGSFRDASNTTGQIGLGVSANATQSRSAIYTSVSVATLGS